MLLQYYSVLQSTTPGLQTNYSSTSPYYSVLQSTSPTPERMSERRPSSTTPYYASTTKASKTSISCEASTTFQATSFQNERFVRGFHNFSSNKLPKRAFRARLPQLFKQQASKTSISCEASTTFQATSFQNERFVRDFLNFPSKELPKSCACHAKRENDLSP